MEPDFDLAEFAVGRALKQGAKFADARLENDSFNSFLLKNGVAEVSGFEDSSGLGVRVLVDRTAGFAATNNLSRASVKAAVDAAIRDAKRCSKLDNGIVLCRGEPNSAKYEVRQKVALDSLGPDKKLAELFEIEKAIAATKINVPYRFLSLSDSTVEKYYVNSEGSRIFSRIPSVNFYYYLTVVDGGRSSQRYWQYGKSAGFEALKEFSLPEVLSEEVIALKKNMDNGVKPPKGKVDVVVAPQITGIMVHESGGHPYEADRILGREAAQAGESFITGESLGMQLGSKAVNIIDDPSIPNSFGFYMYDDEGIKAEKKQLMKNGKIVGLLHCRETAAAMKTMSNASARASAYDREAIVRMSNTMIEPGDCSEDELIEGVKSGIYMKTFSEWNIDDRRVNQKYVGADAYLIKNGRIAGPVVRPTLEITTFALYRAIDAVANNVEHHAGSCGKGEPMQAIPVWFGGPSMRIRNVVMRR